MSTIKSSAEDLTLNADGSGNDVIIQSDGSTKAIVTAEGNVGIGITPAYKLHVSGALSRFHRSHSTTTSALAVLDVHAESTGAMADGFGPQIRFISEDSGDVENTAATLNVIRDGADTAAAFVFNAGASETVRMPSSGGITFNGDTSSSNALNDYEVGTFTPTINASSVSYNTQIGRYTKIGNRVFIDIYINISSISTTSSYSIILGLPFASSATYYPALTTKVNGFAWGGSATMLTFQVQPSATSIGAAGAYNNGGFNDVNANGLSAGDWIAVSGSYTV